MNRAFMVSLQSVANVWSENKLYLPTSIDVLPKEPRSDQTRRFCVLKLNSAYPQNDGIVELRRDLLRLFGFDVKLLESTSAQELSIDTDVAIRHYNKPEEPFVPHVTLFTNKKLNDQEFYKKVQEAKTALWNYPIEFELQQNAQSSFIHQGETMDLPLSLSPFSTSSSPGPSTAENYDGVMMVVANTDVGKLMGKGGQTLAGIREQTKSNIKVYTPQESLEKLSIPNMRVLTVSGGDMELALRLIHEKKVRLYTPFEISRRG